MGPHAPSSRRDAGVGMRTEHGTGKAVPGLQRAGNCATSAGTDPPRVAPISARMWHLQGRASSFLLCTPVTRTSPEASELPAGPCDPWNEPARRRGVTLRSCREGSSAGGHRSGGRSPPACSLRPRAAPWHFSPGPLPEPAFLVFPQNIFKCIVMKYDYENAFSPQSSDAWKKGC